MLRYGARMPSLLDQIREALAVFTRLQVPPALIGGLALAAHDLVRATRDVDFLVDADDADRLHGLLLELGYQCVHRSTDAANYLRGEEGFDLLYAHRPIARRLLSAAEERDTPMGRLRVVSAEGLMVLTGADPDRVVLVGEGGVTRLPAPADPIQAWIDLMEVVRMLRPPRERWAARPVRGRFLL